jgi:hypothetical protein
MSIPHIGKVVLMSVLALCLMLPAADSLAGAPPAPDGPVPGAQGARPDPRRDAQRGLRRLLGVVVSVDGDTLVVDPAGGPGDDPEPVEVTTTARTRFRIPDVEDPGVDDLAPGMTVAVQGRRLGRRFLARGVMVLPESFERVTGEVAAVAEDAFTLDAEGGTTTVQVQETTRFRLPGVADPGLDDLAVSDTVIVAGERQDDALLVARLVARPRPRVRDGRGTVTSVDDASLTVQPPEGDEVVLTVTDATEILVPNVVDPTLDDVLVGDTVHVRVQVEGDVPTALRVAVIPPDAASLLGVVVALDGTTVQVETRTEQVIAVPTDAATEVRIPGLVDAAVADLRAGDRLRVGGAWIDASTFEGWLIQVGKEGRVGQAQGRVLSLGADAFVLGSPHGALDVAVDDQTRYRLLGVEVAGFADLEVGQWVSVRGLLAADGTLLAREVRGRPQ